MDRWVVVCGQTPNACYKVVNITNIFLFSLLPFFWKNTLDILTNLQHYHRRTKVSVYNLTLMFVLQETVQLRLYSLERAMQWRIINQARPDCWFSVFRPGELSWLILVIFIDDNKSPISWRRILDGLGSWPELWISFLWPHFQCQYNVNVKARK